jgi:hypothetical protein
LNTEVEVREKATRIHESGLETLRIGQIKAFTLEESLPSTADRFFVGGVVEDRDLKRNKALSGLLVNIASMAWEDLGPNLEVFLAGQNFPLHFTIGEGRAPAVGENIFAGIAEGSEIKKLDGSPLGTFLFDTLVLDKGNALLTASAIPPEIVALRAKLDEIYPRYGFTHLKIENLFHMTLSRISDRLHSDEKRKDEQLRSYTAWLTHLGERVKENPIEIVAPILRCLPTNQLLIRAPHALY